jgi:hypothetical protein
MVFPPLIIEQLRPRMPPSPLKGEGPPCGVVKLTPQGKGEGAKFVIPPPLHPLPPETVSQLLFCHPEFISGSHKPLILLDAEISSA